MVSGGRELSHCSCTAATRRRAHSAFVAISAAAARQITNERLGIEEPSTVHARVTVRNPTRDLDQDLGVHDEALERGGRVCQIACVNGRRGHFSRC